MKEPPRFEAGQYVLQAGHREAAPATWRVMSRPHFDSELTTDSRMPAAVVLDAWLLARLRTGERFITAAGRELPVALHFIG